MLETPTTLLLSLIRSTMTAITRNSYQESCGFKKHQSQVAAPSRTNTPTTDLNKVPSDELGLGRWDEVIQNLPPLPEAELHDVPIDGRGVVSWREPCEKNTVLRAIGCEAPWWSKKHQWFWGT